MKRRDFLSAVASSPLLNTITFDKFEPTKKTDFALVADSKRYSRRLFKYRLEGDERDRSVSIYHNDGLWFETVRNEVEKLGFDNHCIFDIEFTDLIYCSYSTDTDSQTVLYEIEPALTVVSVHQYEDHIEVAGKEFETTEDALVEIQRITPDKRGNWAL